MVTAPTDHLTASSSSPPPLRTRTQVRVMIVEDEREVFEAAARVLEEAGYDVCEQVATGEGAPAAVLRAQPEVVLMDIQLGGDIDGIAAARSVRESGAFEGSLIYLTAHAEGENLERAHATRPEAFLLKPVAPRQLLATLELAVTRSREERRVRHDLRRAREALNQVWEVTQTQLDQTPEAVPPAQRAHETLRMQLDRLSSREREVFERAVRGEPLEQLARELFISPHTARNHLAAIYRKLGVNSRLELSTTYLPVASEGGASRSDH